MKHPHAMPDPATPRIVGSFGNAESLAAARIGEVRAACDLVEIRLDLLEAEGILTRTRPWAHLAEIPLLFTVRREDEGGAGNLTAAERIEMLGAVIPEAALIDVEWVSAGEMAALLETARDQGIPWVASWHDFEGRPDTFAKIPAMAEAAARAGAACFKAAVRLHGIEDLARLGELQAGAAPLPLALMGMGPLAPVSRLLCAQHGAALNYGYIGNAPTAPGQWSAKMLKEAVAALTPV
jgi:3-dehydroquinate dehydratase-1